MELEDRAVRTARTVQHADVRAIAHVRHWATAFAAERGMTTEGRAALAAAVSEAVTNVVRHAYPDGDAGDIVVDAAADHEWLSIRVTDHGLGAGPTSSLGLGLPLMTELAERIEFGPARDGAGTVVLMEFPLGPAATASADHEVADALLRAAG